MGRFQDALSSAPAKTRSGRGCETEEEYRSPGSFVHTCFRESVDSQSTRSEGNAF